MTIKKLVVPVLSFFASLLILSIIWGENGYFVTRSLARRYEELKRREELYSVELESLGRQLERSRENDYLDDIALSLGYNREGEKVYYFENEDEINVQSAPEESIYHYELYRGEPLLKLALISVFISFVTTSVYTALHLLFSARREKELIFTESAGPKRKKAEVRKNSYDDIGF